MTRDPRQVAALDDALSDPTARADVIRRADADARTALDCLADILSDPDTAPGLAALQSAAEGGA